MDIVVADDSALIREGIGGLLERRGDRIVGYAVDSEEVKTRVQHCRPEVLITDVRMPPTMTDDGLRTAIELRVIFPDLNILVLSQYVAPAYATRLFEHSQGSGGVGYLLKDRIAHVADFLRAVDTVSHGGVVMDPDVATALMNYGSSGLGELTERESQVMELMAQGDSNSQIAEKLVLSAPAVAKHVSNIFSKLGLSPDEENRRVRAILTYLTENRDRISGGSTSRWGV